MTTNSKQKKIVRIVGLLAITAIVLTSFAPAIAILFSQK
jgi:hypothetical protein